MKKRLAILGSTGSVGTQALDVASKYPGMFEVETLAANSNSGLLIRQAMEFNPNTVVIADKSKYNEVNEALSQLDIKVFSGNESVASVCESENIDIVVATMVGFSGLLPVLKALGAGKKVALANKETLVAAGSLIKQMCRKPASVIPVDSEHSAIFQCIAGEYGNEIEKIYLTASGGPFRNRPLKDMPQISVEEALAHPNWKMGSKISVDSATLMNKGLEMIEAHWLFGINPSDIEILVHPQSVIHSMVQFADGSVKAQMSVPDMRLAILYALSYPERFKSDFPRLNFTEIRELSFENPDYNKFPCIEIAYNAIAGGGNMPCVMNAANEVAVQKFLQNKIKFTEIPGIIAETLEKAVFIHEPTFEDLVNSDKEARYKAYELK